MAQDSSKPEQNPPSMSINWTHNFVFKHPGYTDNFDGDILMSMYAFHHPNGGITISWKGSSCVCYIPLAIQGTHTLPKKENVIRKLIKDLRGVEITKARRSGRERSASPE
jgi:hypothetical protein